jgi:hypothetical protein
MKESDPYLLLRLARGSLRLQQRQDIGELIRSMKKRRRRIVKTCVGENGCCSLLFLFVCENVSFVRTVRKGTAVARANVPFARKRAREEKERCEMRDRPFLISSSVVCSLCRLFSAALTLRVRPEQFSEVREVRLPVPLSAAAHVSLRRGCAQSLP